MSEPQTPDRRQPRDRRTREDRRRGGEGRHLVLHLGRTELQAGLTVCDAKGDVDLLYTTSLTWRAIDEKLPAPEAAAALTDALKQLVASERLSGCQATLILHGDLCVTRVATGPTSEVRQSLDEIDERSQLYLSLGAGAKAIATSRVNLDARHERAVVSVASQTAIEQLVEATTAAGLELRRIEAETVALARAHGALHPDDAEPVILVQCDDGGFEVVVAHQGTLLLDYRPGLGVQGASLIDMLNQHHARLERFCQRQLSDFDLKLRKVYVAGQDDQVRSAISDLSDDSGFEAHEIDVEAALKNWQRTPDALGPSHAVLLGGLLREIDAAPATPAPNLIERWIAESRKHIRPMLLRSASPIAATLVIALGMGLINLQVSGKNAALDEQLAELQPARIEHDQLRLQLIAAQDKVHRLQQLDDGAHDANLTRVLTTIGGCLPDDVWLDRMTISDVEHARVSGASYSESGVYDFVRHLNVAPTLEQVALEGTGSGNTRQGPATSFDLKLLLASLDATRPDGGDQ